MNGLLIWKSSIHSCKYPFPSSVPISSIDPELNEYPSFPERYRKRCVSKNRQQNFLIHQGQANFAYYNVLVEKMLRERLSCYTCIKYIATFLFLLFVL